MLRILFAILTFLCLGFILTFNVIGDNWDMGGYSEANDLPVGEAFKKPRIFPSHPSDVLVIRGHDLILTASAFGGGLNFQWYQNGEPIPGANENVYTDYGVQVNDSGAYSLKVSNEFGTTVLPFQVTVKAPNELSQYYGNGPIVLFTSVGGRATIGRPFTLSVVATDGPNSYRWFKNGQVIVNATSNRLYFKELKRTDAGVYHVEVANKKGYTVQRMRIRADRELDDREG